MCFSITDTEVLLPLDDEEVSLVIEAACPEGGNAADVNHAANAPDDDTLSVGPDMPDLPLDVPPTPDTTAPPASTLDITTPEEVPPAPQKEVTVSPEVHPDLRVEEQHESTIREPESTEPQVEEEEGAAAQQHQEVLSNVEEKPEGGETATATQEEREEEEHREECAPQSLEVTEEDEGSGQESQQKQGSDTPATTNNGAATIGASTEETSATQEAPKDLEGCAPPEVTDGVERSSTCNSLFASSPSRRKNRPCSLPVSELETVIASSCGEPETPRSHYIRIHHLLHSLPSAQCRPASQDEEVTGEEDSSDKTQETNGLSPTIKTSKDGEVERQEEEEEEDTTHSPSQVALYFARKNTNKSRESERLLLCLGIKQEAYHDFNAPIAIFLGRFLCLVIIDFG